MQRLPEEFRRTMKWKRRKSGLVVPKGLDRRAFLAGLVAAPAVWPSEARARFMLNQLTGFGGRPPKSGYQAPAITINGAYLRRPTAYSNVTNSRLLTFSFWVYFTASAGTAQTIYTSANDKVSVTRQTNNNLHVMVRRVADQIVLWEATTATPLSQGAWHHVMISGQLTGPNFRNIYVNDAQNYSEITWQTSEAHFLSPPYDLFNDGAASELLVGYVSDFWFTMSGFVDLSSEVARRNFIDASGKPVFLGENGELGLPGDTPAVFFSGDAAGFGTNRGDGGAFTQTGTFLNAPSSPSD